MNINNVYVSESDYLKSGELEKNTKYPLTIKEIGTAEFGDDGAKQIKLVLAFNETNKKMVVNKTNANTISSVYSPETDGWIGKKISIYVTSVQFGDRMVDAIRVEMPMQVASLGLQQQNQTQPVGQQQAAPDFDDDIPF